MMGLRVRKRSLIRLIIHIHDNGRLYSHHKTIHVLNGTADRRRTVPVMVSAVPSS